LTKPDTLKSIVKLAISNPALFAAEVSGINSVRRLTGTGMDYKRDSNGNLYDNRQSADAISDVAGVLPYFGIFGKLAKMGKTGKVARLSELSTPVLGPKFATSGSALIGKESKIFGPSLLKPTKNDLSPILQMAPDGSSQLRDIINEIATLAATSKIPEVNQMGTLLQKPLKFARVEDMERGTKAFYRPSDDGISLPEGPISSADLFHEMTHAVAQRSFLTKGTFIQDFIAKYPTYKFNSNSPILGHSTFDDFINQNGHTYGTYRGYEEAQAEGASISATDYLSNFETSLGKLQRPKTESKSFYTSPTKGMYAQNITSPSRAFYSSPDFLKGILMYYDRNPKILTPSEYRLISKRIELGQKYGLYYDHVENKMGGDIAAAAKESQRLGLANGGMVNIPKFEKGINMVPANMLAMLHKNEAVVPANMNPFNPNAQSYSQPSISYNISPVINAAPGMDEQAIANMATRQVLAEIKVLDARNNASMGRPGMRVVGK
jgi:hypothetical protein